MHGLQNIKLTAVPDVDTPSYLPKVKKINVSSTTLYAVA
jgi:hypothetical protein